MKIEKILNKIPDFNNIILDTVLFESKYPVMFTCKNGNDIYLFICYQVNAEKIAWIATKTTYENLIDLLENKITIRDAFLDITEDKIMISYNGQKVDYKTVKKGDIPDDFLPAAGEYMDAEEDEYAEELAVFRNRSLNVEYIIKPHFNNLWIINFSSSSVTLPDEYFNADLGTEDATQYKVEKIYGQRLVFA